MRGAEAIIEETVLLNKKMVKKIRIKKRYRERKLDERLRKERNRAEARLLHKAKLAGVKTPTVYEVEEYAITLEKIDGKRPGKEKSKKIGEILAKLHANNIIHGDFTVANLIEKDGEIWVIDFGLGYVSSHIEDMATDVFTLIRSGIDEELFWEGYYKFEKATQVKKRVKKIKERIRYAV